MRQPLPQSPRARLSPVRVPAGEAAGAAGAFRGPGLRCRRAAARAGSAGRSRAPSAPNSAARASPCPTPRRCPGGSRARCAGIGSPRPLPSPAPFRSAPLRPAPGEGCWRSTGSGGQLWRCHGGHGRAGRVLRGAGADPALQRLHRRQLHPQEEGTAPAVPPRPRQGR